MPMESVPMRLAAIVLLLGLVPPVAAEDALWKRLGSEPNLVVLMRHTQPAGGDPVAWDRTGHCAGESMLTPEGKAHAARIGKAFAGHGVAPVVVSSPMCRCRDTASLAFGGVPEMDADLREVATADPEQLARFERTAQSMIVAHRGRTPLVLVSHRPNIDRLTMELVESGDLLVARATDKGELELLGKITVP